MKSGALQAAGMLDRGPAVSNHDPLERRMQHSLNTAVMHMKHDVTRVHFFNRQGHSDFGSVDAAHRAPRTARSSSGWSR